MRTTFAVGRLTPDSTEIVLVRKDRDDERPAPVPGPWSLRAVVRARGPSTSHATSRRVH